MFYKIKDVATLSGVSVRTLHYYDEVGLLKPNKINESGYRLYTDKELEILQKILFFKELDFSLDMIKNILLSDDYDKRETLKAQKELLEKKRSRLDTVIKNINKTIKSVEEGIKMSNKDMFNGFDVSDVENCKKKYEKETKDKYSNSSAYKEYKEKTDKYDKGDWSRIIEEANEIYRGLAKLMDKNPEDEKVQELVQRWRYYISNNFYDCKIEIFRGLADLYVTDERFKENIDKFGMGLAEFLSSAIIVYCDNN